MKLNIPVLCLQAWLLTLYLRNFIRHPVGCLTLGIPLKIFIIKRLSIQLGVSNEIFNGMTKPFIKRLIMGVNCKLQVSMIKIKIDVIY